VAPVTRKTVAGVPALQQRLGGVEVVGVAVIEGERHGMGRQDAIPERSHQIAERQAWDARLAQYVEVFREAGARYAQLPWVGAQVRDAVVQQDQPVRANSASDQPEGGAPRATGARSEYLSHVVGAFCARIDTTTGYAGSWCSSSRRVSSSKATP
jgi:hypothetical protein